MACRLTDAKPSSKPMLKKLLIGPLETNFNEILIGIYTFSFKKMHLKVSSGKCRPFFLGLNVLILDVPPDHVDQFEWRHMVDKGESKSQIAKGPS